MRRERPTEAEPRVQVRFRIGEAFAALALFAGVLAAERRLESLPDREALPAAVAVLELYPVALPGTAPAPLKLVGAWRVRSSDPRVGGLSGLALDGEALVALTDSGAIIRFPKSIAARLPARVADLPAGPGDPAFKMNRDSEAVARDPGGRGWWVAFENRDQLWLFDHRFERALRRVAVPGASSAVNRGIEGLAVAAGGLLAFPESGGSALLWRDGRWSRTALAGRGGLSEAVRLEDGAWLLVERQLTSRGFRNALVLVRADGASLRTVWRARLPVGRLDNVEGLAAEPLAGGGYRLWMVSDDNFHPRLRTLLIVVDIAAAALPKRP